MLLKKSEHKENSKAWWDEKYLTSGDQYLYGKEPSKFLVEHLDLLPKGAKVVDIGSGEGRNAVALAAKGYDVTAIDFSATAQDRAKKLAVDSGVNILWKSSDLDFYLPELLTFDAIVCIDYKPPVSLLKNLSRGLKQKGILILEASLVESAKSYEKIELFECYKPNELLLQMVPSQSGTFQIQHYSELGATKWGDKVFMIAKKTQLL